MHFTNYYIELTLSTCSFAHCERPYKAKGQILKTDKTIAINTLSL